MLEIDEIRKERNLLRHEMNKIYYDIHKFNNPDKDNPRKIGDFYYWQNYDFDGLVD